MKIDWFTIAAQALNFLILVWLMKRFLYRPILTAIAARETLIASELSDAKNKKEQAQKEHAEFDLKNKQFDQQRADLLAKATAEVKVAQQRLLEEARRAVSELSLKLEAKREADATQLNQITQRKIETEVFSVTRKVLVDLAGVNLNDLIVDAFIEKLNQLSAQDKGKLLPSAESGPVPSLLTSAFNLSKEFQSKIESALKQNAVALGPLKFETNSDLISGIALLANGQKLAWNISDYLTTLSTLVETKKAAEDAV